MMPVSQEVVIEGPEESDVRGSKNHAFLPQHLRRWEYQVNEYSLRFIQRHALQRDHRDN